MKLFKKIDIYHKTPNGLVYLASTNRSRTCREACLGFASRDTAYLTGTGRIIMPGQFNPSQLRAYFDKWSK